MAARATLSLYLTVMILPLLLDLSFFVNEDEDETAITEGESSVDNDNEFRTRSYN